MWKGGRMSVRGRTRMYEQKFMNLGYNIRTRLSLKVPIQPSLY